MRGHGLLAIWRLDDVRRLRARQDGDCPWCLGPLPPIPAAADLAGAPFPQELSRGVQIDHIIPRSLGGPDAEWNKQLLHGRCNVAKRSKLTRRALALAAEHGITLFAGTPAFLRRDSGPGPCAVHKKVWPIPPAPGSCRCLIHIAAMSRGYETYRRWPAENALTRWPAENALCGEPPWSFCGKHDLRDVGAATCEPCRVAYAAILAEAAAAPM